jgi:hypothetical protein
MRYCDQLTRPDRSQSLQNSREKRPEVFYTISNTYDGDHGDTDAFHVLLKLDARIVRDEYVESCVDCSSQQDTIPKSRPAPCAHGGGFMIREF